MGCRQIGQSEAVRGVGDGTVRTGRLVEREMGDLGFDFVDGEGLGGVVGIVVALMADDVKLDRETVLGGFDEDTAFEEGDSNAGAAVVVVVVVDG